MIGPMSSFLSLAQRTASKARATMDTMARQIATGQKVSSVKDDGAAWARAAGLRSDAHGQRTVAQSMNFVRQVIDVAMTRAEPALEQRNLAREAALRATDPTLSASERALLDAQQEDYFIATVDVTAIQGSLSLQSTTGVAWHHTTAPVNNILSVLTNASGGTTNFQGAAALAGFNSAVRADLSSAAAAAVALDNITRVDIPFWVDRGLYWSSVSNRLDRQSTQMDNNADRLDVAASTLTEVDFGRASTALRQAETRQQMAVQTMRTAISAYGNFAGGLLGNVQRTQRGLLA